VAIVDVQMPPERTDDGLRAAIAVRRGHPRTAVLVLSNFLEERYPLDLIGEDAEGVGYLLKSRVGDVGSFIESVRRVAGGGSALVVGLPWLHTWGSGRFAGIARDAEHLSDEIARRRAGIIDARAAA